MKKLGEKKSINDRKSEGGLESWWYWFFENGIAEEKVQVDGCWAPFKRKGV